MVMGSSYKILSELTFKKTTMRYHQSAKQVSHSWNHVKGKEFGKLVKQVCIYNPHGRRSLVTKIQVSTPIFCIYALLIFMDLTSLVMLFFCSPK